MKTGTSLKSILLCTNCIMYQLENVILIVAIYIYIYIYENFCVAKFIVLFIYC